MTEYFGIYDNTVKRWIVDGNTIIHYPQREIAEAHLTMLKSKSNDFVVRSFGEQKPIATYQKKNK